MKNLKKLPTKQLEKFSNIFTQLGLVLVLFIVYLTLEHETKQNQYAIVDHEISERVYIEPDQIIRFTKEKKAEPKKDMQKTVFLIPDEVVKGDNEITETIVDVSFIF